MTEVTDSPDDAATPPAAQAKQGSIARIANSAVFEQAVTQGA